MEILTKNNVESLIGKVIRFTAPVYQANHPIDEVCKVLSVDFSKRMPIEVLCVKSDCGYSSLQYGYLDEGFFVIGDDGRCVQFEIC